MRAPDPLATTNGSPPTPPNARTGEFTPPGKSSRARAITACERSIEREGASVVAMLVMVRAGASDVVAALAQHVGRVDREVGQDEVGAGAADREQRLDHRARAVEPPALGGRLEHRVL